MPNKTIDIEKRYKDSVFLIYGVYMQNKAVHFANVLKILCRISCVLKTN